MTKLEQEMRIRWMMPRKYKITKTDCQELLVMFGVIAIGFIYSFVWGQPNDWGVNILWR